MRLRIRQRWLSVALLLCLFFGLILWADLIQSHIDGDVNGIPKELAHLNVQIFKSVGSKENVSLINRNSLLLEKLKPMETKLKVQINPISSSVIVQRKDGKNPEAVDLSVFSPPNYDVHAFYYPWYGSPQFDKKYLHWNHQFLQHWNKQEMKKWKSGQHSPPEDIGANFYPLLGAYSSRDRTVITQHMVQLRQAGIGVLSLSWYPPDKADSAGEPSDELVPVLLDIAQHYHIKINFHIEPYKGRDAKSLRSQVKYIIQRYGNHPAFYQHQAKGRLLPLFYVYDSYLVPAHDWSTILKPEVPDSVRGSDIDAIFIGLLVELKHKKEIASGGFDGFYTYFASNGFTVGSSWTNWAGLSAFARANGLLFIPSVGPGYIDTEVRPWNGINTKDRGNGKYYEESFKAAIDASPSIITVTSFNEWHEGTQIEPAIAKVGGSRTYLDYTPNTPEFYLHLTRTWAQRFQHKKQP